VGVSNNLKEVMPMIIKVPHKNYGIVELYDTVAITMGHTNTSELEYDCCKINIASNIQDGIYEEYLALGMAQNLHESDIRTGITMLLAVSGPKVNENLADDEVEVLDGFIC
jgi:hypothetical protein